MTRLFFLHDAQPAGFPKPFTDCVPANIAGWGMRPDRCRLRGWRLSTNPTVSLVDSMAA